MSQINAEDPTAAPNGDGRTAPPSTVDRMLPLPDVAQCSALATCAEPSFAARTVLAPYAFGARHVGLVGMTLIVIAGVVARAALLPTIGHAEDTGLFYDWSRDLARYGLRGFYESAGGCNYPPLFVLVMRVLGYVSSRPDLGLQSEAALRILLKLPACLADLLAAVLLFIEARRLAGPRVGLTAAALYFLNPVAIYNSAYWGQVDGIHSALLVAALVATNRMRVAWAGFSLGLALLMKLQSIAFAPLFIFDVYRWRGFRGCAWLLGAALGAGLLVLSPFIIRDCTSKVLSYGYVGVVGQYAEMTVNAFNPWFAFGSRGVPDATVPPAFLQIVSNGAADIPDIGHWLLKITWRRVSLVIYVAVVALVLSIYAFRRGGSAAARALCAAALGLAFFLCLTEMHERYSHPIFAVLALWAAGGAWKERAYLLLSCGALLNLTFAQPPDQIGFQIGVLFTLALLLMLAGLALPTVSPAPFAKGSEGWGAPATVVPPRLTPLMGIDLAPPPRRRLVRVFQACTALLVVTVLSLTGTVLWRWRHSAGPPASGGDVQYLSDLKPRYARQGYGELGLDRSLSGGLLHIGDRYYFRGLGTHADFRVIYALPPGYDLFEAVVGINREFDGEASISVAVDGHTVVPPTRIKHGEEPVHIEVPVAGGRMLQLIGDAAGRNKGDHVDWGLARLSKTPRADARGSEQQPTAPAETSERAPNSPPSDQPP